MEGWESALYNVKALAPVCDDLAGEPAGRGSPGVEALGWSPAMRAELACWEGMGRPWSATPHPASPTLGAAAVYPPQDSEELASAAEALATTCDLLQEECPLPAVGGGEGAGDGASAAAGTAALRAALEGVQAAQAALTQRLAAGDDEGAAAAGS